MIDYVPFGVTIFLNQQVKNGIISKKIWILTISAQIYLVSYRFKNLRYGQPLIYTYI